MKAIKFYLHFLLRIKCLFFLRTTPYTPLQLFEITSPIQKMFSCIRVIIIFIYLFSKAVVNNLLISLLKGNRFVLEECYFLEGLRICQYLIWKEINFQQNFRLKESYFRKFIVVTRYWILQPGLRFETINIKLFSHDTF